MKKQLLFIVLFLFNYTIILSQNEYSEHWKNIQTFEKKSLPKSALKEVEIILTKAKKLGNHSERIKALIYQSKYLHTLEEDATLKIIKNFKNEIKVSSTPKKNVLENILANLYWQYFQQNRWKFYNRTKTSSKIDPEDFRTWDLQTLFNEVHIHFQNALKNEKSIQNTAISEFENLLIKAEGSKKYRPTLYDLMIHNALDFYKTSETGITKPQYAFEIDDPAYINVAKDFTKLQLISKDTLSLQRNAISLFQKGTLFHKKSKNIFAHAFINIERLKFIYEHATFAEKKVFYLKTLISERNGLKNHEATSLYDFEIAKLYQKQAESFVPKQNETHQWKLKEAISVCDQTMAKFPNALGSKNCEILKKKIMEPSMNITAEKYVPISKPSRFLITYKNISNLKFKLHQITESQLEKFNAIYKEDERIKFVNTLKVYKSWDSNVKNVNDYQIHTTEILLPKLEKGIYLIVAETQDSTKQAIQAYGDLQSTDLTLISYQVPNNNIFQVVNRNNGCPIANVKVHLKTESDRYNRQKFDETRMTNENGEINIGSISTNFYNIKATVSHKDDIAIFKGQYVYSNTRSGYQAPTRMHHNTFLFTDRSIYRPGQVVYFKGITMHSKGEKDHSVSPNLSTTIKLRDANGQQIGMLERTTNEYGSFHGKFILPSSGLTGTFSIQTSHSGYTHFSVEEYKRPKFETKFIPIKETFKVNDKITIKGTANAYAGNPITNAKVTYHVVRKVKFPIWCYWYWPGLPSESREIKHGETQTDDKGEYQIEFKAIPDATVSKETQPVFQYEVTANVTDINGETRTTVTTIHVGYHSTIAKVTIDNELNKKQKNHKILIETTNLNNQAVETSGTIKIYKLKAPLTPLRNRPWKAPDYPGFTKEEFHKLFPHDAFENESDFRKWDKGSEVYHKNFNTKITKNQNNDSNSLTLGSIQDWNPGRYIIELSAKDPSGQEIKDIQYTKVIDPKAKIPSDQQLLEVTTDKAQYQVGEKVALKLSSASQDISVMLIVQKKNTPVTIQRIQLSQNSEIITIPIKEEDLGGFTISYTYINYNDSQSKSLRIPVPYPSIDLTIETKTFRNRLKPGEDEQWSFTIKGPDAEKVTSEVLASMYDASLDQFKGHDWYFNPITRPSTYSNTTIQSDSGFKSKSFLIHQIREPLNYIHQNFDQINWFGLQLNYYNRMRFENMRALSKMRRMDDSSMANEVLIEEQAMEAESDMVVAKANSSEYPVTEVLSESGLPPSPKTVEKKSSPSTIPLRKNLNETAFFYPQLTTDSTGNVSFNFTTPEALTRWRLQILAHTKELYSSIASFEAVTQKELMVLPNPPRFLRSGDTIVLSSKLSNLTAKPLQGEVTLELIDALTNKKIDRELQNTNATQEFTIASKNNTQVSWSLKIPNLKTSILYKIIAKTKNFSDGEQQMIPVLSNQMLVTETLPMAVRSDQSKEFILKKLKNNTSTTLKHHKLTLEMTANPIWYAVKALPYLMEQPMESSEQIFSRYYANKIAASIANSNPKIQQVFKQWKNTEALESELEKNQELKSLIVEETPWLRDALSEASQRKRIALLFDKNTVTYELQATLSKLKQMQLTSGGFPWYEGGYENRYITQHIISGLGRLIKLNILTNEGNIRTIIQNALRYLDHEFVKEYENLKKYCEKNKTSMSDDHLSYMQIHYLYSRSFFLEIKVPNIAKEAKNYYLEQAEKYGLEKRLYAQGLLALTLDRMDKAELAQKIVRSLDENSITSEELGMYWKSNTGSWYWYQAPIETQALMVEVFSELMKTPKRTEIVDNLKIWLLKNKQTNRWKSSKATADAVYALLLRGTDWLQTSNTVEITLGDQKINPNIQKSTSTESGSGYFKTSWHSKEIKSNMATAKINKKGEGVSWGALYWQYFEDLDKITTAKTPLAIQKKLFKVNYTASGEEITDIQSSKALQLGDLVRVRVEIKVDRDMQFVHMKDMRASGLEPVNVLSSYKLQDGLGYYESTKDTATHFFFDNLYKGIYVFEYDLRVNNKGSFSNGITTIQCMYAPEFSSHSEGMRIHVD